ncbi:hypothetical protein [Sulfurospirillum arcachonense]|uniref:hypothetical protein n=1 Tax=Sulfurospirillum arcachonense TaxID=57666 RepID=UPI000468BCCA|nr:hypothetical protein [Sulfurospirillum arcachonense]
MTFFKFITIFFLLTAINIYAQNTKIDNLLEKVNQASTPEEKKELIEKLKQELATTNKKERKEADAIIKAKQKMPLHIYDDSQLNP